MTPVIKTLLIISFFFSATNAVAQEIKPVTMESIMKEVSAGRQYVFAFFKKGAVEPRDSVLEQSLQMEHLKFLFTLKAQGKISVFGPFINAKELEGMVIFNSKDAEEVKKILDDEPYMKSGMMKYELLQWFGLPGASLPE